MPTVAFVTLGCKVNQVETEQIKEAFYRRGYQEVGFQEKADFYIINTCTVTHVSDRKSRAVIRRAARNNPEALIVVTGCLAQVNAGELAEMKDVNLVVGNGLKQDLFSMLETYLQGKIPEGKVVCPDISVDMKPQRILYQKRHQRTRAFVKVQDGCESFCSYCIVPYSRGPMRSKLPQNVVEEIQQLVRLGYKEIVLTGIHVGYYGKELPGWDLLRLIRTILDHVPGEYRLRLGSIEALSFPMELARLAAEDSRLCSHFHIPLQSGSDDILQQMNRLYTRNEYRQVIEKIDKMNTLTAFTTDVMVGFPGETERDFEQTRLLIEELPFFTLHVFPYSRRPGTPAALKSGQVGEKEKKERSGILLRIAEEKRQKFLQRCQKSTLRVLVERKISEVIWLGLSDQYAEVRIHEEIGQDLQGEFLSIPCPVIRDGMLYAEKTKK